MGDFIFASGWSSHNRASLQHLRSVSSSNTLKSSPRPLPQRPISKSTSTSVLPTMSNSPSSLSLYNDEDRDMSTIPDPRSRTMTPSNDSSPSSPAQHPDLSNEVAMLSTKLIKAINHQTNLDDTLSATRQELEAAREQIRKLELETAEHKELLSRGVLIRKSIADNEKAKLVATIAEERRRKTEVEKGKKGIEQELENLSVALFEEAQKMVITAKEEAQKEYDIVQKRNDQLKAQLRDTEGLLKFQQEQLAELKQVMEHMTEEKDDQTNPTAPSTPGLSRFDSKDDSQGTDTIHKSSLPGAITPTYPTSFTHLLQLSLRTDLTAFEDFISLLQMSKNVPTGNRVSSGSYGSIGLGLGIGAYVPPSMPANGSTTSLSTSGTQGSVPVTPTTPASTTSTGSANGPNAFTPLKDTKFYKRAYVEDIGPTLRLEIAPGLSWLARRNVLNAINDGTMVVEPIPASTRAFSAACSLCGEGRKGSSHARTHRFRTNETDSAQRYPLCRYCLGRVRSTCDFLGFLRILKDGHWRADDAESEKAAWEETVRLREQMFWCRIGGGCIPATIQPAETKSPRNSGDERKEEEIKLNEELERTGEIKPKDVTRLSGSSFDVSKRASLNASENPPVISDAQTSSSTDEHLAEPECSRSSLGKNELVECPPSTLEESTLKHDTNRDSTQSNSSLHVPTSPEPAQGEPKRLSLTIPGSFN